MVCSGDLEFGERLPKRGFVRDGGEAAVVKLEDLRDAWTVVPIADRHGGVNGLEVADLNGGEAVSGVDACVIEGDDGIVFVVIDSKGESVGDVFGASEGKVRVSVGRVDCSLEGRDECGDGTGIGTVQKSGLKGTSALREQAAARVVTFASS